MVASRSYVIEMEAHERRDLLADVSDLATAFAVDGQVEVPYETRCARYRRVDR